VANAIDEEELLAEAMSQEDTAKHHRKTPRSVAAQGVFLTSP
jgi:hypothetical protein